MAPNRVSKKEARWSPFRKTQPSNIHKTLYRLNNGKDTVVAGRGLIATSDIAKGTQILEDEPLLVIDTTLEDESAFFASERADNSQLVQAAISLLNGPTRRMFSNIFGDNNIDKVDRNGWGFENPWVNANHWIVVGKALSRINHSCVPNAVVSDVCTDADDAGLGRKHGAMRLISTSNIKAGEEISVEYLTGHDFWLASRADRRRKLQDNWGFTCQCIACSDKLYRNSDVIFAKIQVLLARINSPLPQYTTTSVEAYRNRQGELQLYINCLMYYGWVDSRLAEA